MTHRGKRHARAPLVALAILTAMPAAGQIVNEVRVTDPQYLLRNQVFVFSDSLEDATPEDNEALVVIPVFRRATASTTVVQSADLAIEKSAEPPVVQMDDLVTFTVTATNLGPSSAVDLVISDPLPPTIVFVSSTPSAGGGCTTPPVGSNGTVVCTWLGVTLSTQSRSVEIVGRFVGGFTGPIDNIATASSEISDPVMANDSATATVNGVQVAPEIPTLGTAGLVALALGMGALATARLRRASRQRRDL